MPEELRRTAVVAAVLQTAILYLAKWLYADSIITAAELTNALEGAAHRAWRYERPSALDNVKSLYQSI
jgi:hypothetical protein